MTTPTPANVGMAEFAEEALSRIGTKLNSKWTIDDVLGVGGMGAVFVGTHRNGSKKALKLLHGVLTTDPEVKARFLREAMIANKIDHPARVAVIDDDVSDKGEMFLVMDLLVGKTLFQLRREAGKMPVDEVLAIFDTVLDLLDRAHAEGIIHRDIKPGNIFVTEDGSVKVLDFGIARIQDHKPGQELTQAGAQMGTPSYCAPEQARGLLQLVDGRSDLFSVGACMYTALSGHRLHEGQSEGDAMVLAATTPAPSLGNVAPHLPVEVVALVDKALAFERERRFPNAIAMQSELRNVLALWRSGNATIATMRGGSSTTKRANVELDAPDFGDNDEERARIIDRLAQTWKQLQVVLKEIRHVGWTHPQTGRAFKTAVSRVGELVNDFPSCCQWIVTPAGFEMLDTPLWTPDRIPFDRVPYQLFADGVRRIQFKDGINEEELRDFLGMLSMLATQGLPPGDDSVTFLWDKRFEYIAYEAVDALVRNDDERRQIEDLYEELLPTASHNPNEDGTEVRAYQKNISDLLQGVSDVAADCALDPLTRSALGAQCGGIEEDEWWGRFADAFERAFIEAKAEAELLSIIEPVEEWVRDHIALANYEEILRVFDRLSVAIVRDRSPEDAERLVTEMSRMLVGTTTLKELLLYLTKEGQQQTAETPPELPVTLLRGLRNALRRLNAGDLFGLAAGCFESMRERKLRQVLFEYMKIWASGRETEMGQMGVTAGPGLGSALVKLLEECGDAGQPALLTMLSNLNPEVRIEAMSALKDENRIRIEVRSMLENDTESGRLECLRLVAKRGLTAAGAVLVVRALAPAFHALSGDEKRLTLETVFTLKQSRGIEVATKLLRRFQIIPRPRAEETRRIACELLANAPADEDVVKALKKASTPWWWNTKSVRTAARAALDRASTIKQLPAKTADAPASTATGTAPDPSAEVVPVPPDRKAANAPQSAMNARRSAPGSAAGKPGAKKTGPRPTGAAAPGSNAAANGTAAPRVVKKTTGDRP